MSLLNKSWRALIQRHYAWSRLPERGPNCLLSSFIDFTDSFSELTGIEVPDFPGETLTQQQLKRLGSAKSFGIRGLNRGEDLVMLLEDNEQAGERGALEGLSFTSPDS